MIDFSSQYVGGGNGDGEQRIFVLAVSGDLDTAAADELATALSLALDEGPGALFVNLRDMGRLDPIGFRCLIHAKARADRMGVHLAVIRGASPAYRVLTLADAESVVELAGETGGAAGPVSDLPAGGGGRA